MKPIVAIPTTAAIAYRAWSRKSLTLAGIVAAIITAIVHAIHPWSAPFALLIVFYLGGNSATKVKHDVKAQLTISSAGATGGESTRTHIQVLANSIVASILVLLHLRQLALSPSDADQACFSFGANGADLLVVGIVANYASVAADTFSSELGILSKSNPRLITSPTFRVVPRGTNGAVTGTGLLAGLLGAFIIALTSIILLPFCNLGEQSKYGWGLQERVLWVVAITLWGGLGSIVDSVLGGLFQASVVDKRTGKIVEGSGGRKVLIHASSTKPTTTNNASLDKDSSNSIRVNEAVINTAALKGTRVTGSSVGSQPGVKTITRSTDDEPRHESRRLEAGHDLLDNNAVNVLMAGIMSVGGMALASYIWEVPLGAIFT